METLKIQNIILGCGGIAGIYKPIGNEEANKILRLAN